MTREADDADVEGEVPPAELGADAAGLRGRKHPALQLGQCPLQRQARQLRK